MGAFLNAPDVRLHLQKSLKIYPSGFFMEQIIQKKCANKLRQKRFCVQHVIGETKLVKNWGKLNNDQFPYCQTTIPSKNVEIKLPDVFSFDLA